MATVTAASSVISAGGVADAGDTHAIFVGNLGDEDLDWNFDTTPVFGHAALGGRIRAGVDAIIRREDIGESIEGNLMAICDTAKTTTVKVRRFYRGGGADRNEP